MSKGSSTDVLERLLGVVPADEFSWMETMRVSQSDRKEWSALARQCAWDAIEWLGGHEYLGVDPMDDQRAALEFGELAAFLIMVVRRRFVVTGGSEAVRMAGASEGPDGLDTFARFYVSRFTRIPDELVAEAISFGREQVHWAVAARPHG